MASLQAATVEIDAVAESVRIIGCPPELEVEIHLSRRYRTSDGKAGPDIPYNELRLCKYYRRLNLGTVSSFLLDTGRYLVAAEQLLSTAPLYGAERSSLENRVTMLLSGGVHGAAGTGVHMKIVADVRATSWTDPASLEERDDTCAACLERFQDNKDNVRIACSHKFHADCIQQCMNHTQTCPLCRSVIGWCLLKV